LKPRLFVGSSAEALDIAYAVQENLEHDAEVTVWQQGVFDLSKSALESLLTILETKDYGVFVFTPDDVSTIRDEEQRTVRDNVIFELGLFMGRLGRDRSFILMPRGVGFRLPTDLIGVTPAHYKPDRQDGNLQAATGSACNQIRKAMAKTGPAPGQLIIKTAKKLRECNLRLVAEAENVLFITGSRSRDKKYLRAVEDRLRQKPLLRHYRVLFGPPHHQILKDHVLELLRIRDPADRAHGFKTLHLGLYKTTLRQFEAFILGNEKEALVLLPSFSGVSEYDSCILFTDKDTVVALQRFVKQLYTASELLETAEQAAALKVLKQTGD